MTYRPQIKTAIFPGAGSAHVWHAEAAGIFEAQSLDVEVVEVRSSSQQMEMWDSGLLTVMHTAPDHLLRRRERDPVAIRSEGIGPLRVFARSGVAAAQMRWGVDGAESAFALVLRAVVEASGTTIRSEDLLEIGGTRQRLEALLDNQIDGAVLHAPFDRLAADKGFEPMGSHLTTLPNLVTVVVAAPRAELGSERLRSYVAALDSARDELLAGGQPAVAEVLRSQGWGSETADEAAAQMLGRGGLAQDPTNLVDGLAATIRLRQRYFPGWRPDRALNDIAQPI